MSVLKLTRKSCIEVNVTALELVWKVGVVYEYPGIKTHFTEINISELL